MTFVSCELFDPKATIPAYIHIENINLATNYVKQGSTSSKFTDAWVYVDDQPIGAFPLPTTFPVLMSGQHEVEVRGGIKIDGISANRTQYPFCSFYTQSVNLQSNVTVNIIPTVNYFPALTFEWLEDFENIGTSIVRASGSDTSLHVIVNNPLVFEGKKSGAVYLDASHTFFEGLSAGAYTLPDASDVYLELNYNCNNSFSVGVYSAASTTPYTTSYVNSSNNQWNKIYINLVNEITTSYSPPYSIFISMQQDNGVSLPVLYLDNIKLIHQ